MKKIIFVVLIILSVGLSSFAQCDKKISLSATKAEHLNANNEIQRSVDENLIVEYDSKEIKFMPGAFTMDGTISSITCNWETPFKKGKTVIKASLSMPDGQNKNTTFTIDGIDDKVVLYVDFEEFQDMRMRYTLDKFEEKK